MRAITGGTASLWTPPLRGGARSTLRAVFAVEKWTNEMGIDPFPVWYHKSFSSDASAAVLRQEMSVEHRFVMYLNL